VRVKNNESPAFRAGYLEDRALALDVFGDVRAQLGTVLHANLGGVGAVRLPLGRSARGGLLHHLVDLLEGQTLGLGDEEPGVHEGARAQASPDEEDGGLEVALVGADHVRGDDSDDGVPEPVGCSGESNTTGADREREDLADDDPGTGTPGAGEEEDEDGDEGNLGVDGGDVNCASVASSVDVCLVEADGDTDDGNKELADQHAKGTPDKERTTSELLNGVERDGSGADVDEGEDQGDQEGVADGTGRGEEGGGVVEDEVDTSPLLHHLHGGTEDGLAQVGVGLPDGAAEAVGPALCPAAGRDDGALVFLVGNDLGKLSLDVLAVGGLTTQLGERGASLFDATALDEVSRGVGKACDTDGEDDTPGELDADGNAVLAAVTTVLDSVVDASGNEETEGDGELVTSNEGATDFLGANLRHVQNDNGGLETDTNTGDETTSNDQTETSRSGLENDTWFDDQ
jgi:hypothetical protein